MSLCGASSALVDTPSLINPRWPWPRSCAPKATRRRHSASVRTSEPRSSNHMRPSCQATRSPTRAEGPDEGPHHHQGSTPHQERTRTASVFARPASGPCTPTRGGRRASDRQPEGAGAFHPHEERMPWARAGARLGPTALPGWRWIDARWRSARTGDDPASSRRPRCGAMDASLSAEQAKGARGMARGPQGARVMGGGAR